MNVLVLGKGGREHAIIRALSHSDEVKNIFALPGRAGFAPEALSLPSAYLEKNKIKQMILEREISLVVIGSEKELALGWSDYFRSLGVPVFGPSKEASQLESSKLFAKRFMETYGIPTSSFKKVSSVKEALIYKKEFGFPLVLKADGLAGGKGVFICHSENELIDKAQLLFEEKKLGSAGEKALLESFQKGHELSVFVLTNGEQFSLLPFARDYKKLSLNKKSPNTGGMGAFAPYVVSEKLKEKIEKKVIQPSIKGLKKQSLFYRGILYIGLMVVEENPVVLEYNVRFGDPEAQVLLPLLKGDWKEVFFEIAEGRMPYLKWREDVFSCCVVVADNSYPLQSSFGSVIKGDLKKEMRHSYFLQAGVGKNNQGEWITDGGRILNAIGIGLDLKTARYYAYQQAELAHWPSKYIRSDIGSF